MASVAPVLDHAHRQWRPRRVVVTADALDWPHGAAIAARAEADGVTVIRLPGKRLTVDLPDDPRRAYAEAKATLAVVVASEAKRRLQPIPPSADFRVDLAEGCPAHCQYCYLAGSLKGAPVTKVYANLPEILDILPSYLGQGRITSRSVRRAGEGTTFEASCYTDPLAIEHLTGSLSALVTHFGVWGADASLRFTSKFAAVEPLLGLAHNRRTRMRASVTAPALIRYEGGTDRLEARLYALGRMARAGYPVGLTIAPIMPEGDWRAGYGALIDMAAAELDGVADLDLTAELITHRFSDTSRGVLQGWYPGSSLEMDPALRDQKTTKFGSVKHVYPAEQMKAMKAWFYAELGGTVAGGASAVLDVNNFKPLKGAVTDGSVQVPRRRGGRRTILDRPRHGRSGQLPGSRVDGGGRLSAVQTSWRRASASRASAVLTGPTQLAPTHDASRIGAAGGGGRRPWPEALRAPDTNPATTTPITSSQPATHGLVIPPQLVLRDGGAVHLVGAIGQPAACAAPRNPTPSP